jgi:hypothetical protein
MSDESANRHELFGRSVSKPTSHEGFLALGSPVGGGA